MTEQTGSSTEKPSGPLLKIIKDQRTAFLIVGGINTGVGFLWFVFFQLTIGQVWGYLVALVFSHITSMICAFLMQRYFVFRVRGHWWRDLYRFEIVQLGTLAINFIALPFLVQVVHLNPIPAQAIITAVTVVLSWFGHRHFSFRRKEPTP